MIEQFSYIFWNTFSHDKEVNDFAVEGDLCFYCEGYLFLLQRSRNSIEDYNNLMFEKITNKTGNILKIFKAVESYLKENGIEYIRIEGSNNRYNWLKKYFDVVKDEASIERNIQYCRLH